MSKTSAKSTFPDVTSLSGQGFGSMAEFKDVRVSISNDFRQLVSSTTIENAFLSHEVFYAKSTDSIAAVFHHLINKKIMAVPILDVNTNKWVAWIDILDIMVFVIERLQLGNPSRNIGPQLESWITQSEFTTLACNVLFSRAARNPWVALRQTDSLEELINIMGKYNCHRVAVLDAKNHVTSVVTMSALTRWIQAQGRNIGNIGLMTLRQLNLGFKAVVSVRANQLAHEAFVAISKHPIGGVAVVDHNNHIIGNISANDFKEIGWAAQMFGKLYLTCEAFCNLRIYGANRPQVVSVTPDSTLSNLIATFNAYKIHRTYIVTETGGDKQLHGVVALGDVFRLYTYTLSQGER